MKTKDLIKALQEEDPTGENHVRVGGGGALISVVSKPGYWDGPYQYIDENGIFVETTEDDKIDLLCRSVEDVIWDLDGDMDKIKEKIRVEYSYCDKKHENDFWKYIENESKTAKEFKKELYEEIFKGMLEKINKGWKIVQSKSEPIGKFFTLKYKKGLKKEGLNAGEHKIVFNKNMFEPVEKGKYIYWILKNNNKENV